MLHDWQCVVDVVPVAGKASYGFYEEGCLVIGFCAQIEGSCDRAVDHAF